MGLDHYSVMLDSYDIPPRVIFSIGFPEILDFDTQIRILAIILLLSQNKKFAGSCNVPAKMA